MARIRSIKPELRTSITVSLWPREVRYFFILLWGYFDDYGRGVDDELLIASDCFPRDRDVTPEVVDEWLEIIAESGPLCRYEVDGRNYLHAPNWREHQKPSHPTRSKIPPCPEDEPDDFKRWREVHPQRIPRRSRKSREEFARDSPASPTSLPEGSGRGLEGTQDTTPPVPVVDASNTVLEVDREDIDAGQASDTATPEALPNFSGTSPEHFVPEQGSKGARERGSKGARGCGGEADLSTPRAADTSDRRPDGLHSIPDDFHLNDTMRRWVVGTYGQLLNPEFETEQFISYWRAEGRKKRNWHDAWQKWIRDSGQKASERAQRHLPVAAGAENVLHLADRRPSTADQRATAALAVAAELAAEENQ